jgi:amino acid transporter
MQPYSAFIGLILLILVILFNSYYVFLDGSWDPEVFVCAYIGIPFFFIVYFVYKFWTKSKWVSLDAMDFESGRRVLDEMEDEQALMHERETKTVLQKVWDWMM